MRTLILNASYEPLMVLPWERAFTLVYLGKAQVLETYSRVVRSIRDTFTVPCVVRLLKRVRVWKRGASYSRRAVFERDNNTCQYCGMQGSRAQLTLDHVLPKSRGGVKCWTNMVVACEPCNLAKGDRTPEEAGMPLLNNPVRPMWSMHAYTPSQWRPYLWG